jgi:hypothetical protein
MRVLSNSSGVSDVLPTRQADRVSLFDPQGLGFWLDTYRQLNELSPEDHPATPSRSAEQGVAADVRPGNVPE